MKTIFLTEKKILTINGLDPYEYFEGMIKKEFMIHSTQGNFIEMFDNAAFLNPDFYQLKKDDLQVSIKFEGEEELVVEYTFAERSYFGPDFKEYYLTEKKNYQYYSQGNLFLQKMIQ